MIPRSRIVTQTIDIATDGAPMRAYLARPDTTDAPAGAVLVAGELFGISAHVRDVTERIAALGLPALALDLFHRDAPGVELPHDAAGRERGLELLGRLTREHALADVRAGLRHFHDQGIDHVAMVGISVGGHVAYLAATELPLAATAVVYGGWIPTTDIPLGQPAPTIDRTPALRGRLLFLVGSDDHVVPADHRKAIAAALAATGGEHELVEHPGAPHGFLCDRRESYRAEAADDAWRRIAGLLGDVLSPPRSAPAEARRSARSRSWPGPASGPGARR